MRKHSIRWLCAASAAALTIAIGITGAIIEPEVPAAVASSTINQYYPSCGSSVDATYGCGANAFSFTGFANATYCTSAAGNCNSSNPSINVYDQANGATRPANFSGCWMYVSPNGIPALDTQATTDNLGYYTGFTPSSSTYQVDHSGDMTGCQLEGQHMGAFLNPKTAAVCSSGTCQGGGAIWYYPFQGQLPEPWLDDGSILDSSGGHACIFSNEWVQYSCPTFRMQVNWDVGRYSVTSDASHAAYSNVTATFYDATDNASIQWQIGLFDTRQAPPAAPAGEGISSEGGGVYDVWTRPETGMSYGILGCSSQNYEQTRQPAGSTHDWYEMLLPWYQMYGLITNLNSTFGANLSRDSSKWALSAVNAGVEMVPGATGPGGTSTVDYIGAQAYNLQAMNQAGGSMQGDGSVC